MVKTPTLHVGASSSILLSCILALSILFTARILEKGRVIK